MVKYLHHKIAALATVALTTMPVAFAYAAPVGTDGAGGPGDGSVGGGGGVVIPLGPNVLGGPGDYTVSTMTSNIMASVSNVPTMVSMTSFIAGISIGVTALFKLKDHVDKSGLTPLREGMGRLATAGALLALPFILTTMEGTITAGQVATAIAPPTFLAFAN